MIIGAVVENIIRIIDGHEDLYSHEREALEEACVVMSKLPRLQEASTYEAIKK